MAKILHIMLTGPVTDGWNYQDNLLTKYQRRLGHEVTMITSQWIWGEDGKLAKCLKTNYRNENDVKVLRLPIHGKDRWGRKFKTFEGLYEKMQEENPDILFVHNVSFSDMDVVVKYIRNREKQRNRLPSKENSKAPFVVYVDNHSDFSNSGTNWISRNILHRILWKSKAKKIEPYTRKFYGVMPARVDWLVEMYGLPKEKCELLVMGADDDKICETKEKKTRTLIRNKFGIGENDFLIVTGGKIDHAKKQTLLLMEAVKDIVLKYGALQKPDNKSESDNPCIDPGRLKLLIFGSVSEDLKASFNSLVDGKIVQYAGWISPEDSYDYFSAAELVVFPGRHSVFWEQVVGMGIPMICKYWEGTTHIDIGGNVKFIHEDNLAALENVLSEILLNDGKEYRQMLKALESDKVQEFSYLNIADKCSRI